MAQVLKDNLRQAIIQAAKQEFLLSGFEKASMRNIAKMANMTVGNLYRYFDSKQDIKNYILTGTMNELKNIFNSVNSYNIKMEARVFNIKANSCDKSFIIYSTNKYSIKYSFFKSAI